jgi:hypothetical protein
MNGISTSSLASDQSALLHALMAWPREPDAQAVERLAVMPHALAARGLHAYRANAHAGAVSALRAAYPVLEQMLGSDSFEAMAKAFWHQHPPLRGDWACWGAALPEFLERDEQLADVPFLPDMARLEWSLHELAVAPDAVQDPASFALLTAADPERLHLQLAPHRPVWHSAWPVLALFQAHPQRGAETQADAAGLVHAQSLLGQGAGQSVLLYRDGWRCTAREALAGEAQWLAAIDAGDSVAQALERSPDLDFAGWLQTALQTRLLIAVTEIGH